MKRVIKILFFLLISRGICIAQETADSLLTAIQYAGNDSIRYQLYEHLVHYYNDRNKDSSLYWAETSLAIAKKNKQLHAQATALNWIAYQLLNSGHYAEAYVSLLQAIQVEEGATKNGGNWPLLNGLSDDQARLFNLTYSHKDLGHIAGMTDNREEQLLQYMNAQKFTEQLDDPTVIQSLYFNIASVFMGLNQPDSALLYLAKVPHNKSDNPAWRLRLAGSAYMMKGNLPAASKNFYAVFREGKSQEHLSFFNEANFELTKYYLRLKQKDSSLHYAYLTWNTIDKLGLSNSNYNMGVAYENLFEAYKLNNEPDSTSKYLLLAMQVKDSLNKQKISSLSQLQSLSMREQIRLQNLEKEQVLYQGKVKTYTLTGGLLFLAIIAAFLYMSSRQKQKAKQTIEDAYTKLKSTQSQLIQSEKMASLGELTAGIAHEIQNPLNFVNNFSEVNKELIEELKSQKSLFAGQAGKLKNEELDQLLDDIAANEEKINHHGKRADAIVKGMLQHSRKDAGEKEATDINALTDEYLRLSFHGMRAKDKSFNADFKTDFDDSLSASEAGSGKINIVPQDIGKVLLNLYNNALHATNEKKKTADETYQPTVTVQTRKVHDKVEIRITDNGNGIPQNLADKIFQPFFTTKPTGQGTGLGLSLSYDIVKAHGGELKVETKEREGSTFITSLPLI